MRKTLDMRSLETVKRSIAARAARDVMQPGKDGAAARAMVAAFGGLLDYVSAEFDAQTSTAVILQGATAAFANFVVMVIENTIDLQDDAECRDAIVLTGRFLMDQCAARIVLTRNGIEGDCGGVIPVVDAGQG